MALLPYSLFKQALFRLDAETAHDFSLNWLANTQHTPLRALYSLPQHQSPMTVAGLHFPNKVGLAAGLDKNARCIDAFASMGFGFIEVGTVTPKGQAGNPKPRMFRLPQADALINRMGFNNDGLDAFLHHVGQSRLRQQIVLGLNIGKNASTPIENAASDYLTGLQGVFAHADYVTINISSPNTHNLRQLQNDEQLESLLSQLDAAAHTLSEQHQKQTPIFLKIAPDLNDAQLTSVCTTLQRFGCSNGEVNNRWGLIATNTTLSRTAVQGLPHSEETGGLSGAPVRQLSTDIVRKARQALGPGFPIIGVGGISSSADALEKIKAGADLVQVYTGFIYQGPSLVQSIASTI